MTALQSITGTVTRVNTTGFMLDTHEGYINPSRFADPPPAIPALGTRVAVAVDGKGFARTITPLEGAPPAAPASTRDRTITRLAVLRTAAQFAASRPDAKSTDVTKLAELWEAWVLR